MSSRTQRYYRKKAEQAIEGVLESIAPGNASWLYHQVMQRRIRLQAAEGIVEDTLVARLVILYEEAANWYTRQQILSLFVNDYSKSELLALIPGLSKWRIDEARKHAFQTKPGQPIDPPRITRCRLDAVKVDHFLDFLSSPSVLQDVAYGTRTLKLESGESLEIPNMVRTVISSHLVRMYLTFCVESNFWASRTLHALQYNQGTDNKTFVKEEFLCSGSNGLHLELVWNQSIFVSVQVCGASLKKSLAGLDSTQKDGVQALATLEDITHQLKQAGEMF